MSSLGRKATGAVWLGGALALLMGANGDNGCGSEPAASGGEAECRADSDCSGDPGVDCVGAWACDTGQCKFECDTTIVETGCDGDDDCDEGLVCKAGECVEPVEETGACRHSGECPDGQYCTTETGDCDSNCAPGQDCPAVCWGVCKARTDGSVCYADSECALGERCDRDPCVFGDAPPDGADVACGGVCAPIESCSGPEDCGPGEICGCAPPPADAPANGLMPCFMQCMPDERGCSADDECGPDEVCVNGSCKVPERECYSNEECPAGWSCQAQCDGGGATPPDDADPAGVPYCPSYCVPDGGTCADTGVTCAPGETCVNECYTVCPDCDCGADDENCTCPCWEECRSGCVPSGGECVDSQCPEGTHCGCPIDGAVPNGLYYCEEKCIPDEAQCYADSDCKDGEVCSWDDCWGTDEPYCDPDDQSCDPAERPPVQCPGRCTPRVPDYDCKSDENCIAPDGQQGYCRYEVCETNTCAPDSDQPCDALPAVCYGYCAYEEPVACTPENDTCPEGTHCEATSNCAVPDDGAGFVPCLVEYQCVADEIACETDCDCPASLGCNEGVCQRLGRMNLCGLEGCTSDAECRDGEFCKIDYTEPVCDCVDCPCSVPRGECVPKDSIRTCVDDSECYDGEICGCGIDPNCPMCDVCLFQCMPRPDDGSCESDADCNDGQSCQFYYPPCAPPPPDDSDFAMPPECEPVGICEDSKDCRATGCGSTVCADHDIATTCEWFDYYECYKYAICDRAADGACGWQSTADFESCMERYSTP